MAKPVLNAPDNGIPHRAVSDQIYGAVPSRAVALQIATLYEFVSAQATGGGAAEWLSGFAAQMLDPAQTITVSGVTYTGKAALIIAPYDKGVVWDGAALPTYMQATPAIAMQAGPLMQPTRTGSPSVSGYNEWGAYHANVRTKPRLDAANALYVTDPYRAVWEDTMGNDTLKGQQWWSGSGHTAGTAISAPDWVTQEQTVLDKVATAVGANVYVVFNGIRPQQSNAAGNGAFFGLINHADMGMWENWGNAGGSLGAWCSITTASTARPSDAQWQAMCQCALDAQLLGKDFQSLNTFAATSVTAGGQALRDAQEFLTATALLASNGSAGGHFLLEIALGGSVQTPPWNNGEMLNPLYLAFRSGGTPTGSSILGNPTDHYTTITTALVKTATGDTGALYQRFYANGVVLANTSATDTLSSALDARTYNDLFTGSAVGSSVSVGPGKARFLVTSGGGVDTTPPVVTITTPATATFNAPAGALTQTIAGAITDDIAVDHVIITNVTTGATITIPVGGGAGGGGGGGGGGGALDKVYWGCALTENLDTTFWADLHTLENSSNLNREFASVRKNYGPDNSPIISDALTQAWTEGRRFQYQNGKPNPNPTYDRIDATTGNSIGGTYWASVAAGHYDSVYIAFFEAVRNAGMWTLDNPLHYSFHHEQSVLSEGGGADYGTAADYKAFHRHVYNLMVNGGGGKGPWHVSKGGNMMAAFVPEWRQFYMDQTYGIVPATGNTLGYTFTDLNPGSTYYDILGADIYVKSTDNYSAHDQWKPLHDAALAMGKPFITGETGIAAEHGDTYVVNYLTALDALLKGWGAGWGAGNILAINWTSRVAGGGDYRLNSTSAILAKYKSMGLDTFYGAPSP